MPNNEITVEILVDVSLTKAWELFTEPHHIVKWNNASRDWHTTRATNDLRVGGAFSYRMQPREGTGGFDFGGTYDEVVPEERITYTMGDGRKVRVTFKEEGARTRIIEVFEAESVNPPQQQRTGWQAILDNFRQYAEKGH